MRNEFHDDIWIASLQKRLHGRSGNVVVSDVRFPNEAAAISDAGGVIIRVERPSLGTTTSTHVTETSHASLQVRGQAPLNPLASA